ncbi:hypothetical protein AVDCRST_MAG84-2615 [uncultured Microcoleus sp.]|uniref:Uncharacterized protein n=1 Tax=uncultured Microcoleus sp. TaxID=259945 RepID=A0A6J4M1X8_9CYAN|nr:hypothetical protein AVDCRST_MAG84-2615 [uncultured Microcoleus sp.]
MSKHKLLVKLRLLKYTAKTAKDQANFSLFLSRHESLTF